MTRSKRTLTIVIALAAVLALMWTGHAWIGAAQPGSSPDGAGERAAVEQLMGYNDSIRLTADQEAVRVEALSELPAPCCAQFTAATCCCECNMARATWGLAKHLIADQGLGADGVRDQVAAWHAEINPDGFSGGACFDGGCSRAFRNDGCGGMQRDRLVF